MSIVVVGLDHRSAPLELLERCAIRADQAQHVLEQLLKSQHIEEAVVLSTCMRTEVYVAAVRFHDAVGHIHDVLRCATQATRADLDGQVFELYEERAVRHALRVASGLESAVLGETEILGQIARAWEVARGAGSCRSVLGPLFLHAVQTGKRARTETAISRGTASIGHAAVEMAGGTLGGLAGRSVLVVGAGDMGASMAVALSKAIGDGEVMVANRTTSRAEGLATKVGGTVVPWDSIDDVLPAVDLVLTSTGSPDPIFDRDRIERSMRDRASIPLVLVDVAVPRDVHPDVAGVPGAEVLDMADLHRFTDIGKSEREREVGRVEVIVQEELARFFDGVRERSVAPVIAGLHEQAEVLRQAEVQRFAARFADLAPAQMEQVQYLTKAIMAKWLHGPTMRLKASAGDPEGERFAEALRRLFEV